VSRRQIGDVLQLIRQVLKCSAMKSSVDDDRQFKLDALGRSNPVKAGESICNTVFPLIEAGSQIQAGSLIEAGGKGGSGEYHRANCTSPGSIVVHCVIRAYCVISRTAVWPTGYFALQ